MSRYIPPGLRNKHAAAEAEMSVGRKPADGYSMEEISHQFDYECTTGTLNGNNGLLFILLFRGQHPQWPPSILCKSNLDLLPRLSTESRNDSSITDNPIDSTSQPERLIPVFTQEFSFRGSSGRDRQHQPFVLDGMYTISSIDYLEPGSKDLIKMLAIKFPEGQQRAWESWEKSLKLKWAVVHLHKEDSTVNPMVPLKPMKRKGVRAILEEMRLQEAGKGVCGKTHDGEANQSKGGAEQVYAESPVNS